MSSKEELMQKAIELSHTKAIKEPVGTPFAAIITKNGQIIAEGWDHVVSNHDPTLHGEVDAIRKACVKLKCHTLQGCEMYTSCEPCLMCAAVIFWTKLDRVYFANKQSNMDLDMTQLIEEVQLPVLERHIPHEHMASFEHSANQVFQEWFKNPGANFVNPKLDVNK